MKKLALHLIHLLSVLPLAGNAEQCSVNETTRSWIIIFLDIDGVLFRESFWDDLYDRKKAKLLELFGRLDNYYSFHWDSATSYFLNPTAVALLETFIDQASYNYNIGVVLSSAWREGRTVEQIQQVFSPWRFSKFIVDKTVDSDCYYERHQWPSINSLAKYGFPTHSRAEQIDYWLREHADMSIKQFIIFDDIDCDFYKKFPAHFVHVQTGLLSVSDIQAATLLLTENQDLATLPDRPLILCPKSP